MADGTVRLQNEHMGAQQKAISVGRLRWAGSALLRGTVVLFVAACSPAGVYRAAQQRATSLGHTHHRDGALHTEDTSGW